MNYQTEEQKAILDFFSKNTGGFGGKFIDVNSEDPHSSPTRCLYERGFTGVCIISEPNSFAKYKAVYGKDMRVHIMNLDLVSDDTNYNPNACVGYVSIPRFMSQFGMDVEFICLNSGVSFDLINSLPNYFIHRLKAICVNHCNKTEAIMDKLKVYGFRQAFLNSENLIAVK